MDKQQRKENLLNQLKETISAYDQGVSIGTMVAILQRIEHELTETALQITDAGKAIHDFTVDCHGVVQEIEKEAHVAACARRS